MAHIISKQEIIQLIYHAVDEFNLMQEEDEQLEKSLHTVLFSRPGFTQTGVLDSMGLVNFLVTLDELMDQQQDTVGLNFDISKALEDKESILKDIESLADYIVASNPQK